jgi:methylmalonyl-CoA/ethylmalonyl-CoA epimerase
MMISRIDHVSVAVENHAEAERFFREVLGVVPGMQGTDPHMKYFWQIYSAGDLSRLEVISPTGPGSFLEGFLESRQAGAHHITFQTPDIRRMVDHLEEKGIPFFGYHEYPDCYWKELFIHPRDAFGVLIQIAEFKADDWLSKDVMLAEGSKWQVDKIESGVTLTLAHPGGGKASVELDRRELMELIAALQKHC